MEKVERFSVSIETQLLKAFDKFLQKTGYQTRSEAIRDLIRGKIVEEEWQDPKAEVVGIITLVYDHHRRELTDRLTNIQHKFLKEIVSTTHIHLDHHNCLEVVIVRGRSRKITKIANSLISTTGVKHGRLITTSTGKALL